MRNKLWKKEMVLVVVLLFMGASIIPNISGYIEDDQQTRDIDHVDVISVSPDDELDQYQNEGYGGISAYHAAWAQSFRPSLDTLTRIELKVGRYSNPPGSVIVSIRRWLYGRDLCSIEIPIDMFFEEKVVNGTNVLADWFEFDFDDIQVIPEEMYYIVFDIVESWDRDDPFWVNWDGNWDNNGR